MSCQNGNVNGQKLSQDYYTNGNIRKEVYKIADTMLSREYFIDGKLKEEIKGLKLNETDTFFVSYRTEFSNSGKIKSEFYTQNGEKDGIEKNIL
jgi:antitoxin component YwqK of YwqJK toxin-antitoxin module